ncbi:MAG TPA: hypothetical protein VJT49_25130 [Amycolatopsis sp.]|nr:hypothetical protein [Amycolatopsis sp.]HKS48333.1 hypothetical protein [Amycolatopsis sp.]
MTVVAVEDGRVVGTAKWARIALSTHCALDDHGAAFDMPPVDTVVSGSAP